MKSKGGHTVHSNYTFTDSYTTLFYNTSSHSTLGKMLDGNGLWITLKIGDTKHD